ncbi:MAG: hypothetical protein NWF12_02750, partial [Candidatus Bathyarchaeota archaeon]|nr:hypothetical protein [Candidatus Bathyarchaeota archaeon]
MDGSAAVEGIYKRTGLCPYTGECESFRTIAESERWMERALSRLRRGGMDGAADGEREYSEESLVDKLEHLKRVRERCYGYNGRCLRFWQFERRSEEERSLDLLKKRLSLMDGIIGTP